VRSLTPVIGQESAVIKREGVALSPFVTLMAFERGLTGLLYAFKGPADALLDCAFSVLAFYVITVSCLSISRSFLHYIVNRAFS
jgi:hypothetical protein